MLFGMAVTDKTNVYILQKIKASSLCGLEPQTFRLTAEHASQLRHRDRDMTSQMKGWLKRPHNLTRKPIQPSNACQCVL